MDYYRFLYVWTFEPPALSNLQARYSVKNGQLRNKHGRNGFYTMRSEESIRSKTTTLFNKNIQVTGRNFEVSDSVDSSSTPTGNFLFENYQFKFQGKLEVTEACPSKKGIITKKWTFSSSADLLN